MVSISIIIPTRNERRNIERLLTSIAADPHPPREVIVGDNHSTDTTQAVVREFWKRYPESAQTRRTRNKFAQAARPGEPSLTGPAWQVKQDKKALSAEPFAAKQISVARPRGSPHLHILTKGPERSFQKNAGAHQAKGSHLLFLDADMEVEPGLLSELASLATKKVQAAVIPEHPIGSDFWSKAIALERTCYQGNELLEAPRFIEKRVFQTVNG